VAVLKDDPTFGHVRELSDLPVAVVQRLEHYFLSYKQLPGETARKVRIAGRYPRAEAQAVIAASRRDYAAHFGDPDSRHQELLSLLKG
jgi:inorganic pyrophosphatase